MATIIRADVPVQVIPLPEFERARIEAIRKMKEANIVNVADGGGKYRQREGK